jgi:hypothetical protein
MEQSEMSQMLEMMARMEAKMDADKAEAMANQLRIVAEMKATQHEIKAHHEEMMAKMDARRGVTPACLEEEEPAPEEPKAVTETEEVPKGATDEEAIGADKGRSRDLRLVVGCRGQLKTRTKCNGGSRQECAGTIGRLTRHFVPAMRKGGLRKGSGKKCRSGIKGPSRTLGNRMGGRSLKKRRTKFNVARGAHKERTRPVF